MLYLSQTSKHDQLNLSFFSIIIISVIYIRDQRGCKYNKKSTIMSLAAHCLAFD